MGRGVDVVLPSSPKAVAIGAIIGTTVLLSRDPKSENALFVLSLKDVSLGCDPISEIALFVLSLKDVSLDPSFPVIFLKKLIFLVSKIFL